jgi:hypothetical protein
MPHHKHVEFNDTPSYDTDTVNPESKSDLSNLLTQLKSCMRRDGDLSCLQQPQTLKHVLLALQGR